MSQSRQLKYHHTPKGIYASLRRVRGDTVTLSQESFIDWYERQVKQCAFCFIKVEELGTCKDIPERFRRRLTIDRIDPTRSYEPENIQLLCFRCNLTKGDFFTDEDMLIIGELIRQRRTI